MTDLILCYSDTHLRDTGGYPPWNSLTPNGFSGELNNMIEGFAFVAEQVRRLKPRLVANLGDLLHTTDLVSGRVLAAVPIAEGMVKEACDEVGAEKRTIPGNHEVIAELPGGRLVTSIAGFGQYGEVILDYEVMNIDGFKVAFVPYSADAERTYSRLLRAQEEADLILSHIDFQGAVYESGERSRSLLSPDLMRPCISGDLHVAHDVGAVHYCGSLVQHRFFRSDLDAAGGIVTFDMRTGEVARVQNDRSRHYVRTYNPELSRRMFDPARVVLQVVTEQTHEEVLDLLPGFEFFTVPKPPSQDGEQRTTYQEFAQVTPDLMLRGWLTEARPSALDEFDNVMKSRTEAT